MSSQIKMIKKLVRCKKRSEKAAAKKVGDPKHALKIATQPIETAPEQEPKRKISYPVCRGAGHACAMPYMGVKKEPK